MFLLKKTVKVENSQAFFSPESEETRWVDSVEERSVFGRDYSICHQMYKTFEVKNEAST